MSQTKVYTIEVTTIDYDDNIYQVLLSDEEVQITKDRLSRLVNLDHIRGFAMKPFEPLTFANFSFFYPAKG